MKKFFYTLILLAFIQSASAQVTWSNKIASIVYGKCSSCHNSNGIAPFALMNYADAYNNGTDIKDDVVDGHMPPWPPDPNFSNLAHPRVLTAQEKLDIADWVDNGMPRGNISQEPPAPVFNNIAEITQPDHIIHAPTYNVNTTNDVYRCFVIPSGLTTPEFITAIEAIPGDRGVVHHILIYSDSTNKPAQLDAADPGPGYTNFGGTGSSHSKLIGVWVPGQTAYFAPTGMGIRLPAHTNIIMQIHYPGGISGHTDSTKLFLKTTTSYRREITIDSKLHHLALDNGPLIIWPNTTPTFRAHYVVPEDWSLMGVGPHMHLLGTSIMSYGVTPTDDTIPFVDIPEWDFHWQGLYSFPKILKIPENTVLYSSAHYDNTSNNPENPNDPPQLVALGESTTDEMMLVYFVFTPYQQGDENIIIDSTLTAIEPVNSSVISTPQLYEPIPNPVKTNIAFQYYLPASSKSTISILNIEGKLIREESSIKNQSGLVTSQWNISDLPAGIYFLNLNADGIVRTKKFVKE
jgi:hypothetical protein